MKTKRLLTMGVIMGMLLFMTSCYKDNNDVMNTPTSNKVTISSTGFSPASLTVAMGSTVTWTNNDNVVHAVATSEGSISSGDIAAGGSYTKTFTTAGTYNYFDTRNTSMTGVLVVLTASSGGGGY